MKAAVSLSQEVGVKKACETLGLARASYDRWEPSPSPASPQGKRTIPSWTLSPEERQKVLDLLHTDRFVDQSPREVYATLLDEGTDLCSVRSMYRVLDEEGEVRERRDPLCHPVYQLLNFWPQVRTRSGPGISPNSKDPSNGHIITFTSCWISSAAKGWAGWSPTRSWPLWPESGWRKPVKSNPRAGAVADSFGSGTEHDFQAGRITLGRLRGHEESFMASCQ